MLTGYTAIFHLGARSGLRRIPHDTASISVMELLKRTAIQLVDKSDANIGVMDPQVKFVDEVAPLPDIDLHHIRAVKGID